MFFYFFFVDSEIRLFFFCSGNAVKLLIPIRLQRNINYYLFGLHRAPHGAVFLSV